MRVINRLWFLALSVSLAVGCSDRSTQIGGAGGDAGVAGQAGGAGTSGAPGGSGTGGDSSVDAAMDAAEPELGCQGGSCAEAGGDSTRAPVCGNGIIDPGETCDDGNSIPGDGCSGVCQIEPNYVCPSPGQPCTSTIICGNGVVEGNEQCDDGNTVGGDGCSANCRIEAGWICPEAGKPCQPAPAPPCGNGKLDPGEQCDDGNTTDGDGCSSKCQIEPGFMCLTPGSVCAPIAYCGDGKLNGNEECDDGNNVSGDGCSASCRIEPFYTCPTPGMPCISTIVCGDLKITGDEACDDGNTVAGDGCSADCKQVEPGYTCPNNGGIGGPCSRIFVPKCGDGILSSDEYCDDGNTVSGDGCSSTCTIEPGYTCPTPGKLCTRIAVCGDGKLDVASGEQCDDGNTVGGDGCSAQCQVETNWVCPTPGQPCVSTVRCGDGKVSGNEQCDDGNTASGDGCSSTCQVECGWVCPAGGRCHAAKCGDGVVAGNEQCDDGNNVAGDGCGPTCALESKPVTGAEGWTCSTAVQPSGCIGPTTCSGTICGNGVREGSEQCDDGNHDTGDGCTPFCRLEPICPPAGGACTTACGDGLLLPIDKQNGQECDDGNTVSGDGCSSDCKIEPGYACMDVAVMPNPLILPIVYHDFKGWNEQPSPPAHPDFEHYLGNGQAGIALNKLSLTNGGVPVHAPMCVALTTNLCPNQGANPNVDWYGMWYVDNPTYNKAIVQTLTLPQLPNMAGVYQYDNEAFFPIDGMGWGNGPNNHNFGFTSVTRYWFEYSGVATLDFVGDDDVWVFINKRLAVDLGGLHQRLEGFATLDAANGTAQVCDLVNGCANNGGARHTVDLGLVLGSVYEIVVFQAERHTTESHYRLTLSNFTGTRSACASVCGDGIVTPDEACDLGKANNTGAYGTCNPDCTLPPYCGDGVVQAQNGEQCDDGVNLTTYGGTAKACAPGCKWAPYCGDGNVDSANGEQCDNGPDNGKGYGFCTSTCQLGPRCGDGVVTNGEQCDDGTANGTPNDKCQADCTLKCGNGRLDAGEQCDDGTAANTGGYGKCNPDCTLGPRCGDGIKNGSEQCDDGKNDGSYGNCAPGCVLGPRCGDGMVQTGAGEVCDAGAANQAVATAYGKGICTTRCLPAPYCGNKAVDTAFGEVCDDGINSGQPGSCTPDCKAYVPLPSCGNGVKDPGEQCDDGAANGTASSKCDTHCKLKCGDGVKDPGEQCDDGVNSGAYGTCNPDCTLAPYCGDGVKNGNEQCDLGAGNSDSAYGPGTCTKTCNTGPYCGDGRIQTADGEQCDSTPECDSTCKKVVIP